MVLPEELHGWHPDSLGRFDERFFVYGEPSRLVRDAGVEVTDPDGDKPTGFNGQPRLLLVVAAVSDETTDGHDGTAHNGTGLPVDTTQYASPRPKAVVWFTLAASCAIGAFFFVNVHAGGSHRLWLATVSLFLVALALVGALRGVAELVLNSRSSRESTNGHGPVIDLTEIAKVGVNGLGTRNGDPRTWQRDKAATLI